MIWSLLIQGLPGGHNASMFLALSISFLIFVSPFSKSNLIYLTKLQAFKNNFHNFIRLINSHNLGLFLIVLKFECGYFFRSKIKFKLPEWSLVILISCWSESWCWPIVIQQRFHFYVLSLFSFHLRNNQINKWPTLILVLRCSWMVLNE